MRRPAQAIAASAARSSAVVAIGLGCGRVLAAPPIAVRAPVDGSPGPARADLDARPTAIVPATRRRRLVVDAVAARRPSRPTSPASRCSPTPETAAGIDRRRRPRRRPPRPSRSASSSAAGDSRGDDFASSTVIQLRPASSPTSSIRDWRDTYDDGRVRPAGGVVGNAERVDRRAHGRRHRPAPSGLRTYHAYLPERPARVVTVGRRAASSATLVMAGLRQ